MVRSHRRRRPASARTRQQPGERAALALCHRTKGFALGERDLGQQLAAASLAPATLRSEQVRHRHALGLPGALEDQLRDVRGTRGHPALELGPRDPHLVGSFERAHVLTLGMLLVCGMALLPSYAAPYLLLVPYLLSLTLQRVWVLRVSRDYRRCRVHL
jgi:hypothetical protein